MAGKRRTVVLVCIAALLPLVWMKAYLIAALLLGCGAVFLFLPASLLDKCGVGNFCLRHCRVMEWVFAFVVALGVWWFIKAGFFTVARVDSSAMTPLYPENSLWMVTKYQYGGAINADNPNKYYRTTRLDNFRRGDMMVFHNPDADTVANESRLYSYHLARRIGRRKVDGAVALSVKERPLMLQRLIGLPGDTVEIREGMVYVDGKMIDNEGGTTVRFQINQETPADVVSDIKDNSFNFNKEGDKIMADIFLKQLKPEWQQWLIPDVMEYNYPDPTIFPFHVKLLWNRSYLGPVVVPSKGDVIELTPLNIILYQHIIRHFEEIDFVVKDGRVFVDGNETKSYRFRMNYYWVMGDNRQSGFDSRYFGFLPENHIVGKAYFMFSN